MQKEYTISVVTGCVVNFSLNLLLISFFLSIGAAVGGLIYVGLLFVMKDETLFEAVDKIKEKFAKNT